MFVANSPEKVVESVSFGQVLCEIAQEHYQLSVDLNRVELPKVLPNQSIEKSSDSARVNINTMAVQALACIGGKLQTWIEAQPTNFGLGKISRVEGISKIEPFELGELEEILAKTNGKTFNRIIELEGRVHSIFNHFSKEVFNPTNENKELYQQYAAEMNAAIGYGLFASPSGHISSGNSTGSAIMFAMAYAALNAAEKIANSEGHPDQEKALSLIQDKAALHKYVSHSLSSALSISKVHVTALEYLEASYFANKQFFASCFVLDFSKGNAALRIRCDRAEQFKQHALAGMARIREGSIWTECPALRAHVDSNTALTSLLRDWIADLVSSTAFEVY